MCLLLLLLLQVDWDLILLMQPPTLLGAIAGVSAVAVCELLCAFTTATAILRCSLADLACACSSSLQYLIFDLLLTSKDIDSK
jgi:hypothetical protein